VPFETRKSVPTVRWTVGRPRLDGDETTIPGKAGNANESPTGHNHEVIRERVPTSHILRSRAPTGHNHEVIRERVPTSHILRSRAPTGHNHEVIRERVPTSHILRSRAPTGHNYEVISERVSNGGAKRALPVAETAS